MAFTNDLLLKTMQVVKNTGGIEDKRFLMLGKQTWIFMETYWRCWKKRN